MNSARRTYYDILEVDPTSTGSEIRKAYLKKSLQYHPDKNPANPEEAKARFVEIGAAYETLRDPVRRRQYDQELRSGWQACSASTYRHTNSGDDSEFGQFSFSEQNYDNYRDIFDATVAGMSEEELSAAVGTVAAVAGIVGSLIGSRILSGGRGRGAGARSSTGGGGGNSILSVAGSMIGSMVASEVAAASVRALHQESVQRIAYKEECRRAIARGEPIPDPPRKTNLGDVVQRTLDSIKTVTQNAMGDNSPENRRDGASHNNPIGDIWKMAAEGVKAAAMKNNTQRTHQ